MIIYNVTVCIDHNIHQEWLQWMKEVHIPEVMETNKFVSYKICRILDESQSDPTFAIQYTCESMEILMDYQKNHSPELQKKHATRYEGKYAAFRTLLEVVD
jgi:hypothetical protein